MSQALDEKAFFDGVIVDLQRNGTLKRFAEPKGKLIEKIHDDEDDFSGRVHHIGDEPYSYTTQSVMRRHTHWLDQQDMGLKSTSIRKAIDAYMPAEKFQTYLQHFCDTQHHRLHKQSIKRSLHETLPNQLQSNPTLSHTATADLIHTKSGDRVRAEISHYRAMQHLSHYPDLVAAVGIYHAAHRTYVSGVRAAAKRSNILSADEKEVVRRTLDSNSFNQFNHFLIFVTLLPLIVHCYEAKLIADVCPDMGPGVPFDGPRDAALKERWKAPVDHEKMKEAIRDAWDIFFEKKLLTRHFTVLGTTPMTNEPADTQMTCPARPHLESARDAALLESLYDAVLANPKLKAKGIAVNQLGPDRLGRTA